MDAYYDAETLILARKARQLVKKGYGRRKIADELDITEWSARNLIYILEGELKTKEKKTKQKEKPTKASGRPYTGKGKKKGSGKPSVNLIDSGFTKTGSRPIDSDIPSDIQSRDCSYRVAVFSDIHYPYQDENAIRLAKAVIADQNPDMIVFAGDIADCYQASQFVKDPERKYTLQEEMDYTHEKLAEWVYEFGKMCEFKFLEGNHEERIQKTAKKNAAQLATLDGTKVDKLLKLRSLGIEFIPADKDLEIGNLTLMHGHLARKHAGVTARAHLEEYGCSVLVGHIHRLSCAWKRNKTGPHAMIENGCLCDFDVEYARFPDWQSGFSIVNYDGEDFSVTQYPIVNHKIITENKVYTI